MQNMSKEFYNYLAQRVIQYFDCTDFKKINKYIFKLDNSEDVVCFYEALRDLLNVTNRSSKFIHIDNYSEDKYTTLSFFGKNERQIVVVPEIDIQPAFMTRLRNIDLDGKILFFVCHNPIDSIVGGMEDLQKEGMPFYKEKVLLDIKEKLSKSTLNDAKKAIVGFALDKQNQKDFFDEYSLHDFENILSVLYKNDLFERDFNKFGLFSDMEFINTILIGNNNSDRIEENFSCFQEINDSVKFGDPELDLDGKYTNTFLKRIKSNIRDFGPDEWDKDISYNDVIKDRNKIEKDKNKFEYRETTVRRNGGDLIRNNEFFVRSDGDKGAKKKKLNLLIFNEEEYSNKFEICVSFTSAGKKDSIKDHYGCEVTFSGKNLIIIIENDEVTFAKIQLNEGYEIKICIVNCIPNFLNEYSANYIIKPQKVKNSHIEIVHEESTLVLNRNASANNSEAIETYEIKKDMVLSYSKDTTLALETDDDTFSDVNKVNIGIKLVNKELPIVYNCSLSKNVSIAGPKIEQMKLTQKQSFNFYDNRLVFGTDNFNTKENLREALQTELFMIKNCSMCCTVYDAENNNFDNHKLEIPEKIMYAFQNLVTYFVDRNTLPSLAYYDESLVSLATEYIDAVFSEFDTLKAGEPIDKQTENILRIGTVYIEKSIALSSLHPLNVAHQLLLSCQNIESSISEDVLKKINTDNLIPFIRDDFGKAYVCVTQDKVPQWSYYYPKDESKFNGKMGYVPRLIKEKIINFHDHFSYLFGNIGNNKLIIDAINLGNCENLFLGIIEYYKSNYGKNPLNIDIFVYGNNDTRIVFECLSDKTVLKKFLNSCGIKENGKQYSELEFSNYLLDHLKYYKKSMKEPEYQYCHLAFIQMDQEEQEAFSNRDNIFSGLMLDGLIAGSTSMYYGDGNATNSGKYRTGYGSKFNAHDTNVIKLANYYNDLMYVFCKSGNPYTPKNCMCTYIADEESVVIEKTYNSANWVVFIDPKVDLHYFKNEKNKNIMIIHYSDQKSTSNGFDAITVTKKTLQYQNVLKEFFESQEHSFKSLNIHFDNEAIKSVIDMFNAINGEWLLKLMSKEEGFRKEKISLLSACKLMMSILNRNDIVWVPISMEEIIRISGAVGLSKKEGLFSAKNLGAFGCTSDDLLMFGIDLSDTKKIKVHLFPVEVKIGYANSNPIIKAKEQIKATRELIDKHLIDNDIKLLTTKFYRNFFAQLAINSADKINLYNILDIQDYEQILDSDIRGRLLNDDFEISTELYKKLGDGIVVLFKDDAYYRDIQPFENITVIELLGSDCYKSLSETDMNFFMSWINDIPCIKQFRERLYPYQNSNVDSDKLDSSISQFATDISESPEANTNGNEIHNFEEDSPQTESEKNNDGMQILFGTDVNTNTNLYWHPNDTEKIMHPNTGIIGTMGTGKTQFTKSLIYQLVKEQNNNLGNQPIGILIFDYKGDYNQNKTDFVKATNAKVYELYHLPFNPFSLPITGNLMPVLPLRIASTFRETISKAYNLGNKQVAALKDCIMTAYSNRGIEKNDKTTWSLTAPTLADVYKVYCESDCFKEDSLNAALSELIDFEIFEPNASNVVSLFDFINGVTVIDLSGYDPSIQNLVVAITLDLFYSQMQANGHSQIEGKLRQLTKFILVDEADNFLKVGFSSIRKILKEGREFGVGTILSTQFLTHFYTSDDDYSKYIYSWIVHNVADLSMRDIKNLFNTTTKSQEEELYTAIKKLPKHNSFVKFGDSSRPSNIRDRAFWEIIKDENGEK